MHLHWKTILLFFFHPLFFYFSLFIVSVVVMVKVIKNGMMSVLSHTRELVVTCNFLTVLYLRSFHIIYFTLTAAATVLSAKLLKRILKHPRPPQQNNRKQKKSYGMPSSHSAAIIFLTTYLSSVFALTWQNILVLLFFHGFSFAVVWSRVRLGHHTKSQVLAGSLYGFSCAMLATTLWFKYFSIYDLDNHIDQAFAYVFPI